LLLVGERNVRCYGHLSRGSLTVSQSVKRCLRWSGSISRHTTFARRSVTIFSYSLKQLDRFRFGYVATSKLPAHSVAVLYNDVILFYADRKLPINALLSDNCREFCGTTNHHFELYRYI
jgi:hypothetical protein